MVLHLRHLWERQHYQFFPMFIIALAGIAFSRSSSIPRIVPNAVTKPNPWKIQIPLLLLLVISLAAACWLTSPWFGMIAFLSFVLLFARNCGDLYPVALPLLLLIPLPFAMDTDVIMRLQRVSSIGASALLDTAGIRHVMSGNVLELADTKLFVAEACSGMGSAFLMLATASVYIVWKHLRTVVAIPLLCSAIVWAVAGNTLRIFLVAYSQSVGGPDLSHGLSHDLVGTATYSFSILMLILTEQALLFVFDPIPERRSNDQWIVSYGNTASRTLIQFWNRRTSMQSNFQQDLKANKSVTGISVQPMTFMAAMLPALLGFSVATASQFWPQSTTGSVASSLQFNSTTNSKFDSLPDDMFVDVTTNPQLLEFRTETSAAPPSDSTNEIRTKTWRLRISGIDITVALDGPYPTWHNAVQDYTHDGWKVSRCEFTRSPGIGNESSVVAKSELYRSTSEHALLLFGEFRTAGTPITAPASFTSTGISTALDAELASTESSGDDSIWRLQMFVQHTNEFDTATQEYWNQTFIELFRKVIDRWRQRP